MSSRGDGSRGFDFAALRRVTRRKLVVLVALGVDWLVAVVILADRANLAA